MWALKTILYFVLFWLGCLFALVNPIWGVVNYMMAYQIHPKDTWWGRPLADLGLRFSLLAVAFTIVGCVTGRKHIPRIRSTLSWWELGVVGITILGALTLLFGHGVNPTSRYAFEKLWKMLLFVLIFGRLAASRRNLKIVIWSLVAGSVYIGYDAYTASDSQFWLGRLDLIGGPDFSTTSGAAAHLSAMLPIIGLALLISRGWAARGFALLAGALTANTIIMCRTRSAFVGLCFGVLAALATAPRVRRYRIQLMIVASGLAAFALTDNHFWDRMGTLANRTTLAHDAAAVSRTEIWKLSFSMLGDYPFGVGPGNFPLVIGDYNPRYRKRSTHNTMIVCMTELGVPGGLIFLSLVGGSLAMLYSCHRMADRSNNPTETKIMIYGLLVSFTTYFVSGLGTERFYCESLWWTLALPLCLHRAVAQEVALAADMPALARQRPLPDESYDPKSQNVALG